MPTNIDINPLNRLIELCNTFFINSRDFEPGTREIRQLQKHTKVTVNEEGFSIISETDSYDPQIWKEKLNYNKHSNTITITSIKTFVDGDYDSTPSVMYDVIDEYTLSIIDGKIIAPRVPNHIYTFKESYKKDETTKSFLFPQLIDELLLRINKIMTQELPVFNDLFEEYIIVSSTKDKDNQLNAPVKEPRLYNHFKSAPSQSNEIPSKTADEDSSCTRVNTRT